MSKICLECGNELPSEAQYCNICGTAMTAETSIEKDPPPSPSTAETLTCPQCGAQLPADAQFCRVCGASTAAPLTCAHCGERIPPGAKFCKVCGAPTAAKQQEQDAKFTANEETHEHAEHMAGNTHSTSGSANADTDANASSGGNASTSDTSSATEGSTSVNWKAVGSVLSTLLTIIVLVWLFTNHPVSDTKSIVFDQWGTIELGDAVDRNFSGVDWRSSKVGDREYLVTFSGFQPDRGIRLSLTFHVNYAGDSVYVKPTSGTRDGEPFSDWLSIVFAMGLIYG
ncbi:zinc ribbon domain-containing protein [Agathobaculum sp.]|uniref:zinc ribbon domain-containing protein n=1 Tax=Agathobaculum sp. TaxID=2048138 RepID=UPI002A80D853|nr:zinc ribbon domain-containing protein [Agathobaculum sp.]MDY3617784.1 zinc ribbon domain-containing protein [Agathobaculum sp.]